RRKPGEAARGYVVFVSYSSSDAWIARTIAEKIQAVGAETWLDQKDLHGGDVILEKIVEGVDRCHEAIVLISPASSRSEYVSFEIGAVQSQRKRITPVLNNVAVDAHALLKGMRSIDLNQFEDYLRQLRERIAQRED
ncbi:MAG: hypothetical protein QOJ16_3275, partial [Acidobacteriota bacterium]|nr:hypothetical protein [Acidobacteriota bacterium]